MCGRFTQRLSSSEFAGIFGARDLAGTPGEAYNVSPTQGIVAIRERAVDVEDGSFEDGVAIRTHAPTGADAAMASEAARERVAERLRWGLVPSWSKRIDPRLSTINAKAETVATSPAYRASFRSKRCIVPVDGFYEWQATDGRKRPFYISAADGRPLAFAGLWSAWRDPDTGILLHSCAVITTTPNEVMAPIHDRMPVILSPGAWATWLGLDATPDDLQALLRPTDEPLVAWEVATSVNNPRNQGAELIRRVEAPLALPWEVPAG